jgi:hypothetical protein
MVWLPLVRVEVEKLATPFARAPIPRAAAPSRKVTVPVGVPIAGATAETVAVKVTDWPSDDGFLLEASPTDVLPFWMTWVRTLEVAAVKLLSPE